MPSIKLIVGCGDVGYRIAEQLKHDNDVRFIVRSKDRMSELNEAGLKGQCVDLDCDIPSFDKDDELSIYYLVPPQKSGEEDLRSKSMILSLKNVKVDKVVLISTTGVYGDHKGDLVNEESELRANTGRAIRRLSLESLWTQWSNKTNTPVITLRVPGIYANSRIPRKRIQKGIPVLRSEECGFTNRIHADDLAFICIESMRQISTNQTLNVSDGKASTITEYLQAAAAQIGCKPLPEITYKEAENTLSESMLSYLSESRKIDNQKMKDTLNIKLRYPNFKEGLKFG